MGGSRAGQSRWSRGHTACRRGTQRRSPTAPPAGRRRRRLRRGRRPGQRRGGRGGACGHRTAAGRAESTAGPVGRAARAWRTSRTVDLGHWQWSAIRVSSDRGAAPIAISTARRTSAGLRVCCGRPLTPAAAHAASSSVPSTITAMISVPPVERVAASRLRPSIQQEPLPAPGADGVDEDRRRGNAVADRPADRLDEMAVDRLDPRLDERLALDQVDRQELRIRQFVAGFAHRSPPAATTSAGIPGSASRPRRNRSKESRVASINGQSHSSFSTGVHIEP